MLQRCERAERRRGRADGVGRGACEFGPARVRLGRGCAGVGWTGWEAGCWAGFSSASWAARLGGEGGLGWFMGFGPV